MIPPGETERIRTQLRVWWVIWAAVLVGLAAIYLALGRGPPPAPLPPAQSLAGLVGLAPLFVSIVLRWLVLPRARDPRRALVLFVAGLGLAEAGGLAGIFLGGPYRDDLVVLGLLGIAQFVPLFARALYLPRASGFIPNR